MCNIKSKQSALPPILKDDQFALNVLCLNSFIAAFTGMKIKVIFICDFCPKELYEPILEKVPFEHEVYWTNAGINDTCLMQYELAKESRDGIILFAECDYTWLPGSGKTLENAIRHFGLVAPYDNLNYYLDKSKHSVKTEIELFEDHHYRTVENSVMTFGMTRSVFEENYPILYRWGYLDSTVWAEMRALNGAKLYIPLPALATHMVEGYLAPGIAWPTLWEILQTTRSL